MTERVAFKRVLKESGLSKSELAYLYVVTSQTIYNWSHGGVPTQAFIIQHEQSMTEILNVMLDKQLLPFPSTSSRPKRRKNLATVLRQVIRNTNLSVI